MKCNFEPAAAQPSWWRVRAASRLSKRLSGAPAPEKAAWLREDGVALVITLIMLALVTFMAVVFLAISRRERASVTVTGDILSARMMADAALARAQSEIAARVLASSNVHAYDLLVSTNYYNPAGFQPNNTNAYNVNFDRRRDGSLTRVSQRDWVQNIANLQYDPRPPVVFSTNLTRLRTNDFRFFLDLNRNGLFEPTGLLATNANRREPITTNFYVGDPQWIGVLEHPDRPHSETNRFVGRYAFIVLPAGKSLDLNTLHNASKRLPMGTPDYANPRDGFLRNQGVGPWEINLAGFFSALNTNINAWYGPGTIYNYFANPGTFNTGIAFEDAEAILRHRYEGDFQRLLSARALFPPAGVNQFGTNLIDYYSDGPLAPNVAPDNASLPWAGSYNPNGYYDIQDLFSPRKTTPQFVNRLTNNAGAAFGTPYDRYTFYRLLAQMGTDSFPAESNRVYFSDYRRYPTNRLHLHFQNPVPNGQTNFIPWTPVGFFTNAADRLLRATVEPMVLTNGARRMTNFVLGPTPVRNVFSVTNIQLIHREAGLLGSALPYYMTNNEYSSAVHRLLQVAANVHDATTVRRLSTTNDYPSVFRPIFLRTTTNVSICGFIEETNVLFLNFPSMTLEQALTTNANAFPLDVPVAGVKLEGVPLVIGAKKGYPNFNKFVVQTMAEVSRRLEVWKDNPTGRPVGTNQMYVIGVSNRFGIEGWNSYQRDFQRDLELRVAGQSLFAFHHRREDSGVEYLPHYDGYGFTNAMTMTVWHGSTNTAGQSSYVIPVETNMIRLQPSAYQASTGRLIPFTTNTFERSFRVPQWFLRITNRLQYVLIDRSARPVPRIIDFVSLDKLVTEIDLSRGLRGDTNAAGGGIFSDASRGGRGGTVGALGPGDMWDPTRPDGNVESPPQGVFNQISVAIGVPYTGEGTWRSANGQLAEKESSIQQFKEFLTGRLTNLTWQVPFTPSRRLYQRSAWEANDPLVHYTAEDLTEPIVPGTTNLLVRPLEGTENAIRIFVQNDAALRQLGPRYRPWGGNPNKDPSNDLTAYALTMKDPLVRSSDDWSFPTNKFANLGMLGRVHRGTPWQTLYLKSGLDPRNGNAVDLKSWAEWSGNAGTHPTNDWKVFELFSTAINANANRGLLSVNQTNMAAWSAVLSGVTVLTNTSPDGAIGTGRRPQMQELVVQPNSPQLIWIVDGIKRWRAAHPYGVFHHLGDVLSAPELTVQSPYLNWQSRRQYENGIDDAAYERIPQQILSLLQIDEPRVVVYAFGQSLKPADRSLVTIGTVNPPIFNLCTNYQVTGEFASKTVLRLDELPLEAPTRVPGFSLAVWGQNSGWFIPRGAFNPDPTMPVIQKLRSVVESYTPLQLE
ncbi:MAG: hypothetical protein AB9869_00670 [Verrucomicrobiia bacterium]